MLSLLICPQGGRIEALKTSNPHPVRNEPMKEQNEALFLMQEGPIKH